MPIIRVDRRHIQQLAEIDYESEHQGDRERKVSNAQMKKAIIKRFNKHNEIFFGYKIGKELIGYVTLRPFPGHRHTEVYWLAVKKAHQGKGIGTKLVSFIEAYAKKDFRKVFIYTGKTMKRTRRFYEKRGYKFVNEFPGYYGFPKNNTAVLYGKKI